MIAEELINQMIPALKKTDSLSKAMQWMEELKIHQIPVVEDEQYLGLLSEDLIYHFNNLEEHYVSEIELLSKGIFAFYNQHFYEVLRLANTNKVEMVAILGEGNNFLGVVTVNDTLVAFADSVALQEQGGILVLALNIRDYSLSEISRLVESNNAKILSTYMTANSQNPSQIQVTLKINRPDLSRVIATFERFNYKIIAKFQTSDREDLDRDRLAMLLKYLDI